MLTSLVPDPGFLRGGGTNSKGACEKLLFVQFSLHENKRNWRAHPCVPLGSVNAAHSRKQVAESEFSLNHLKNFTNLVNYTSVNAYSVTRMHSCRMRTAHFGPFWVGRYGVGGEKVDR